MSEKLKQKRERRKKNKENKVTPSKLPEGTPIIQPLVVRSTPFNWNDFMESYRAIELFSVQNTVRPVIMLPMRIFYHIDVGWSRSFLCEWALHKENLENEVTPTHVLFLDADMVFEHDVVLNLLKHDKKVISGLYFTHGKIPSFMLEGSYPVMYKMITKVTPVKPKFEQEIYDKIKDCDEEAQKIVKSAFNLSTHRIYKPITNYDPYKLVEADAVGAGCLLIKVEVLKELQKHLLKYDEIGDIKETGFNHLYFYFQTTPYCTEDMTFTQYVREVLNEKIYVDPVVVCGHITKSIVDMNDFLFNKRRQVGDLIGYQEANKLDNMDVIKFDLDKKKTELNK